MIDQVDTPKRNRRAAPSVEEVEAELERGYAIGKAEAVAALAALEERGRKGLAAIAEDPIRTGPNGEMPGGLQSPPTEDPTREPGSTPPTFVTGYDHNGEAKDFEVARVIPPAEEPAPEGSNVPPASTLLQMTMPGFPTGPVDKYVIAFGGSVELDRTVESHRALLRALEWKKDVEMVVTVSVRDIAFQERADDRFRAALKVTSARMRDEPTWGEPREDTEEEEDSPCERCGIRDAVDGLLCVPCIEELQALDEAEESQPASVASALDEAIGTALAAEEAD